MFRGFLFYYRHYLICFVMTSYEPFWKILKLLFTQDLVFTANYGFTSHV